MIDETLAPEWLIRHRASRPYSGLDGPRFSGWLAKEDNLVHVAQTAFNNHEKNTGAHVSPFDTGMVRVGVDGLEVRLAQGVDMDSLRQVVTAGTMATIGRPRPLEPGPMSDDMYHQGTAWKEMFRG